MNTSVSDLLEAKGLLGKVLSGIRELNCSVGQLNTVHADLTTFKIIKLKGVVTTAGYIQYNKSYIAIHDVLFEPAHVGQLKETLLHEVGHLIQATVYPDTIWVRPRHPHGREWKHIVRLIGGVPRATCSYQAFSNIRANKAKHRYTCLDCGYEHYTVRALKNMGNRFHTGCRHKEHQGHFNHTILR